MKHRYDMIFDSKSFYANNTAFELLNLKFAMLYVFKTETTHVGPVKPSLICM